MITKDNPIKVRPGITMYVENGQKVYEDAYSGEVFPFEGGAARRELDKMRLQYLSSRPNLLNSGIEDLMGWNLKNARMPKEHELHKIHQVQNLLLGGSRNLDADVMWSDEQKLFTHHNISHLITRNSGGEKSYAKIIAARDAQIPVIMIQRPKD